MASIGRRQIDTKFQNTGILNKAASQSTSLYQKCTLLRGNLRRIRGFTDLFPDLTEAQSQDPVAYLWDLFSTGTPLCYIYDQLPAEEGFKKINHNTLSKRTFETEADANWDRAKKHAIALFAMQLRGAKITEKIPGCEMFTVTELWNRHSTDGLVKVINTITAIVNYLPQEAFEDDVSSLDVSTSAKAKDDLQENIIREMLETERKYVQALETMQTFSNALSQANIVSQDTLHLLFPNLNKLLNFQRRFLVSLEFTAQLPLQVQRWGQLFLENEEEFSVYEPYCVNYKNATELMVNYEQDLTMFNHVVNVKSELPALLLKPIQRVCQYPLLLESLVKAFTPETYEHHYELMRGSESAKRVINKINEAQRRSENEQVVKNLKNRVEDWKGHHIENFGDLCLHDYFTVTKSDVDRDYIAFLFEKIVLLCKEAPTPVNKKKNGSKILKNSPSTNPTANAIFQRQTPLLLKGRIFINNVVSAKNESPDRRPNTYPLVITWKGDDELEFFTMHCRREEQMKQWQTTINRLVSESISRRAITARQKLSDSGNNKTDRRSATNQSSEQSRYSSASRTRMSIYSMSDIGTIDGQNRYSDYNNDEENTQEDDNSDSGDLEGYSTPSFPPSGRVTPVESRRLYRSQSLSIKLTTCMGHNGSKSLTESLKRSRCNSLPTSLATTSVPSLYMTSSAESSDESSPTTPIGDHQNLLMKLDKSDKLLRPQVALNDHNTTGSSIPVRLKVHYYEDIFVFQLQKTADFIELYEKVEKKIRLCGPRRTTEALRVRYRDVDGDMVSLASSEDLQIALENGPQITLFVV